MNSNQTKFIVSSQENAIFVDLDAFKEIDIDDKYGL